MLDTEINLTEQERNSIREIARSTGKTERELLREAVDQFIAQFQNGDHLTLMQKARGIWKDRHDLPTLREMRKEWDRI
jgi:hypothetical protein